VPLEGVAHEDHIEFWLIDKDGANIDPAGVIRDAAEAVRVLRSEGKTVLLHCVGAETRTPIVAAAYGAQLTGTSAADSLARVVAVLPSAGHPTSSLRVALDSMTFGDSA
jgi:protein-tyrosine phosphatase